MAKRRMTGIIAASLLVLSSTMVLSSCDLNELLNQAYENHYPGEGEGGNGGGGGQTEVKLATLTITNKEELTAEWHKRGEDRTVNVSGTMSDGSEANVAELLLEGSVVIVSDHPDIVSVLNRKLQAVGVGQATITVRSGTISDSVTITVLEKEVVETVSIKTAFDSALANGANNGSTYSSSDSTKYAVRAVVVSLAKTVGTFVIYDGESFGLFNNSYVAGQVKVGKTYIFESAITNYYGCFEFANVGSVKCDYEEELDPEEQIAMPTEAKWTATELQAFYEQANTTNVENATSYTNPVYCELEVTHYKSETPDEPFLMVDGFTTTHDQAGTESKIIPLNPRKSDDAIVEQLPNWIEGARYKIKGCILGFNSGRGYFNFQVKEAELMLGEVTSLAIDAPAKTTLDIKESVQLTYQINEEAKFNPVTWTSSDEKVLTVSKKGLVVGVGQGTATVTVSSNGFTSAAVTFNVTADVAECNVAIEQGITGGTIKLDKPVGEKVAPGEYTITPEPETVSHIVKSVYVKIDGGEPQTIEKDENKEYKFLTEKGHSYVFGAQFELIQVSTCADMYKDLKDGDKVRLQVKITALDGMSAWGEDETGGVYIYNWKKADDIDALNEDGYFEVGTIVDIYGKISVYKGLFEVVSDEGAYSKKVEKTINTDIKSLKDTAAVEALTSADVGKTYKFYAKYKSGLTASITGDDVVKASAVSIKFTVDTKEVTVRTSSYDLNYATLYEKIKALNLKANDLVEITAQLSWYNGVQFTFLGVGGDIKAGSVEDYTPEVVASSSVSVGKAITLSAKAKEWYAEIPNNAQLTYAITEGQAYANLVGDQLTGVAPGVVKVTVNNGKVTSDEFTIEVVESSTATIGVDTVSGATVKVLDSQAQELTGEVEAQEVTITVQVTSATHILESVYVKVDGGEPAAIAADAQGAYKYTLEAGKAYVFGATLLETTALSEIKNASDSTETYYAIKGEITQIANASAGQFYIQDANGVGLYMYNVKNVSGTIQVGSKVEAYGYKTSYKSTIEFANTTGKGFVRVYEDNSWHAAPTELTTSAEVEALTLKDVGNLYKFTAEWKSGTYDKTNNSTIKIDIGGKEIDFYINKAYASTSESVFKDLKIGDTFEVTTVLGNYNSALQFLYLPTTTITLTQAGDNTLQSLACQASANSVEVGKTVTLTAVPTPVSADVSAAQFEFVSGSEHANIEGNVLTGVSEGQVQVRAKVGEVVSEAITIEVTAAQGGGGEQQQDVVLDFSFADYATANNISSQTKLLSIDLDTVINASVTATDGNSGKIYVGSSYTEWRMYASGSATITISAKSGYTIKEVKAQVGTSNYGAPSEETWTITNGTASRTATSNFNVKSFKITYVQN